MATTDHDRAGTGTLTSSERLVSGAAKPTDPDALPIIDPTHYRLGSERARGGTGRILEAFDVRLGRTVAVKEPLDDTVNVERFLQEARVTSKLQHPAIIPVYEVG